MNPFADWYLGDVRRRIKRMRMMRALSAAWLAIEGASLAAWVAEGRAAVAVMAAFTIVVFTANVAMQTALIRRLRREEARLLHEARPRPDYTAIARMEREVWGRAFEHEGAPDVAPKPRRYVTWNEDGET